MWWQNNMLEMLLSSHGWYALFKIHWLIISAIVALLYIKYIIRSPLYSVTKAQQTYFFIAVGFFLLLKVTPIDIIGADYLFSVHTLQLSLLFFLVVPFLLLSLPKNFLRQSLWHHQAKFILKILAHPWISLITFNGLISIYYIPTVFNVVHNNILLSGLAQLILFINAFFMWWVIINPIPEIKGLNYLMRALYIFLASTILMPTGFFYIVIQKAHFPMYLATEGEIIPALTLIYDQQLAGGLLKFIQIISYAMALLFIFYRWGKQEQAMEGKVDEKNIRYARGVVIHLDKEKK